MSEHEHHHHHDEEECCCGHHHEHEHHHHHDEEECSCGHNHEHEHHHHHDEEECSCGHHHEHEHHHHHDEEECCCGHDHDHEHGCTEDGIYIEQHMHEGACVVSGKLTLCCAYEALRPRISEKLSALSDKVNEMGGIIGHIKASAEVKSTEMFSVTEGPVMEKTAPESEIELRLAAIVFLVRPDELMPMVKNALIELRNAIR